MLLHGSRITTVGAPNKLTRDPPHWAEGFSLRVIQLMGSARPRRFRTVQKYAIIADKNTKLENKGESTLYANESGMSMQLGG